MLQISQAATFYVRSGAAGSQTGADWGNAFTNLPSTLQRGSVYYVADGEYGSYLFNDPVSGTNTIVIKKATIADHGITNGWSNTYGDGQASWRDWTITTSYWLFDGQSGGGPGAWETGLGFAVKNNPNDSGRIKVNGTANLSNISFRHIEISCNAASGPPYDVAVYWPNPASDISFSHCWIHDIPGDVFQIRGWRNFTFEYSKIARNWQDPTRHGDVFEHDGSGANFVVRYSFFEDVNGTYVCGHHTTGNIEGYQIYGNVFYWSENTTATTDNGIIATLNPGAGGTINNLKVYNNTFANLRGSLSSGINMYNGGSGNVASNNVFLRRSGASTAVAFIGVTHDYNSFYNCGSQSESNIEVLSANPLLNMSQRDFSLIAPLKAGTSLSAPYNSDMFGKRRGSDGAFDRGAIEYESSAVPKDVTPPIVSNTQVVLSNSWAKISWNTSEPSTAKLDYGASQNYDHSVASSTLATSHQVELKNLVAGSVIHYSITCADAADNQASTADSTFTVAGNSTPQLADGLILRYGFNELAGGAVPDLSSNANTGVVVGGALARDVTGWVMMLDGVDDYVKAENSPSLSMTNALSICTWANVQSNGQWQAIVRRVLNDGTHSFPYSSFDLIAEQNATGTYTPRFAVSSPDGTRQTIYAAGSLHFGSWYHFAAVYDGMGLKLYVNGLLSGSVAYNKPLVSVSQPLYIGRNGIGGDAFKGKLDEFRIYNRALTGDEVQALATTKTPGPPRNLGLAQR